MALTTRFGFEIPDVGLDTDTWGDILNAYFNSLEGQVLNRKASDSITGNLSVSGNVSVAAFSYSGNVDSTSTTYLRLPVGTTAQRPATPATGQIRYNTSITQFEGYNGTAWASIGGGATGAGADTIFVLNDRTVTQSYTIPAGKGASTVGPLTINSGVTITVATGARLVVL